MLPQWNVSQPPLGIAYLISFLRSKGFLVTQKDLSAELLHRLSEEKKYIMKNTYHINWIHNFFEIIYPEIKGTIDEWIEELAQDDSQVIGFSAFSINKVTTLYIVRKIKEKNPKKIIILGGPQVSRYEDGFEIINNEPIDYIITAEGEETLYELVSAIKNNTDIRKIKGVLFKEGKQKIDTGERPLINPLDKLPFPYLSDFPLEYYEDLAVPILSSRGCLYRCSFCSEWFFWKSYR